MATTSGESSSSKRRKTEEKKSGAQPLDQKKSKGKEKESNDLFLLLGSTNWENLPSELLQSIFDRFSSTPSIPDLVSFSAVCTSWRSLAKSSPQPVPLPPLIFSTSVDELNPDRSTLSLLNTLTPYQDPRTYPSLIPKRALDRRCCGCSHGHLIFASSTTVIIADIFSSAMFRLPKPPRGCGRFTHSVLTGPPWSSSSCMLLLINSRKVLCWRFGADPHDDWLVIRRPRDAESSEYIHTVTLFNEKLHIMYTDDKIFVLELISPSLWKQLPHAHPESEVTYKRLAECNGELLLVYFVKTSIKQYRIEVYRCDFSEYDWVRIGSIGDWCLFMDFVGRCPLACPNPGKWGGEGNCIYFTGPWFKPQRKNQITSLFMEDNDFYDDRSHIDPPLYPSAYQEDTEPNIEPQRKSWCMLHMDSTEFDNGCEFEFTYRDRWPSYAWVYPSAYQDGTELNIEAFSSSWKRGDFTGMHDSESEPESEDITETDDSETGD